VIEDMENFAFAEVQRNMAAGSVTQSFLSRHLEDLAREGVESPEDFDRLKVAASHIYQAGGETTLSTLETLFLALMLHPEVQNQAQEEIDRVVGSNRLPNFGDRESLPYIECIVQETLRWNPTVPLAIPHAAINDDIYRGMLIPGGSTVIPNIRSMTWDENIYHDPKVFKPERYLPIPNGNGEPFLQSVFGFGRRVCPGQHLAEAGIWLITATVLSKFQILPGESAEAHLPMQDRFVTTLTSHPAPFRCDIRPRSDEASRFIEQI